MIDNVSFTSKINFVDAKTFEQFYKGIYIDFRQGENNTFKKVSLANSGNNKLKSTTNQLQMNTQRNDILKANEFYTDKIRTCTAGGVIDFKTGQCAGFHFYDCLKNFEKVNELIANIFDKVQNPDRVLLLGSKNLKFSNYSIPIFEKICDALKTKVKHITIFKEHIYPYSESNIHYSLYNDTWTIHTMFRPPTEIKEQSLSSPSLLENCFKEIKIANGDSLNFCT